MDFTVVIAPDSFKGSLDASGVAEAIARGWASVRANDRLELRPQADGGEGTLEAIASAAPNAVLHEVGQVTGPDGRPTPGRWLEVSDRKGIVELAQCCGLPLMDSLDPLGATTRGLGEVIRHALGHGIGSLTIGLGGSASTDGGAGALSALGLELLDRDGRSIPDGGGALGAVTSVTMAGLLPPPPAGVTLLADVNAPLLGPNGAAAVFGPQKGATGDDVASLDAALGHYSSLLGGNPDMAGAGAAGGVAYGFATLWGASIESGARTIQRITGLDHAIAGADVVLTGEGRFDATSLSGKVVGEVLATARRHPVRAGVIAGRVDAATEAWTCSLTDLAGSAREAMAEPVRYLELAGREAARQFGETVP